MPDPHIAQVTALVRQLPIRWSDSDHGRDPDEVLATGYFLGADECARVLAAVRPLECEDATGFGRRWPLLDADGWTVAPALPAAVARETVSGCDGEYHRRAEGIWREAVGAERLFLGTRPSRPAPGEPFDLLWYGDGERYLVRHGSLEVDDLFGRVRVPATGERLERHLLRARRVDAGALAGLPGADVSAAQTVEVRRAAALAGGDHWRDPRALLGHRADISSVRVDGGRLEGQTAGGARTAFTVDRAEEGWRLVRRGGAYPFTEIRLVRHEDDLVLTVTLDGEVDALAPGMRGRLVFDLRSDLVALDRAGRTQNR